MRNRNQNLEIFFIVYFVSKGTLVHTNNKNIFFGNNNSTLQKLLHNDFKKANIS